jgi:hypothetical protein
LVNPMGHFECSLRGREIQGINLSPKILGTSSGDVSGAA